MARKLKTYQTSLGFFDQAIAAPSMKAALEAWGADSNLFHQGAAKESDDPNVIAATMAKPGVVLRRPVGSDGPFGEHAELPANLGGSAKPAMAARKPEGRKPKKASARPVDKAAERKAALAYERERKNREREQAREEAARQRERERRQQAIDKAQAALDRAEAEHSDRAAAIRAETEALGEEIAGRRGPLEQGKGATGDGAEEGTKLGDCRTGDLQILAYAPEERMPDLPLCRRSLRRQAERWILTSERDRPLRAHAGRRGPASSRGARIPGSRGLRLAR